jgi:uncharacterized protein
MTQLLTTLRSAPILAMLALAVPLALPLSACAKGPGTGAEAKQAAVTVTMAGKEHRFTVEVARTPEEQALGLMNRTSLPPGEGMLFPFAKPKYASFWMKNTFIPLDMIFIRADGTIDRIAENTIPESLEPVVSGGEVSAVLELAGGTAARLGIDETATVRWK